MILLLLLGTGHGAGVPAACTGCDDWCTTDCPATCTGKSNTLPIFTGEPTFVRSAPHGKRYLAGSATLDPQIVLLHVYGTAFEMGEAQGQLLQQELKEFMPAVLAYMALGIAAKDLPPAFQPAYAAGGIKACLDLVFNMTKPFMPQRFLSELEGLAVGSGMDLQYFHRVSMMGELTKMGCSMIGAWGPATKTSQLLQLRALDWDTTGPFQAYPVVMVRHPSDPDDGHSFVTVGYAGEVGAISGYSSAGVALSEKVWIRYAGEFSWEGMPTMWVIRDILQFATNLETAIAGVVSKNRTNSIFTGIGSKADGEFRALEYAHDNVTVWSDKTGPNYGNHTRKPGLVYIDKHTQPDPGQGAWCLDNLMDKYYGTLDPITVVQQIAPIYQTGDSQVVVYDFEQSFMYVQYPSVSGFPKSPMLNITKAYDRQPTRFNLTALFSETL